MGIKRAILSALPPTAFAALVAWTVTLGTPAEEPFLAAARSAVQRFSPEFAASREAQHPPSSAYGGSVHLADRYNFGRYTRPIADANGPSDPVSWVQYPVQDKRFVWTGVTQGSWSVSFALLQFHYTCAAVFSVLDISTNRSWSLHREFLGPTAPLFGPHFTPDEHGHGSMVAGCVTLPPFPVWPWNTGPAEVCYNGNGRTKTSFQQRLSWDTPNGHVPAGVAQPAAVEATLEMEVDISRGLFPTMVMPLGSQRGATVSKYAGRPVQNGLLTLRDAATQEQIVSLPLEGAVAASDDTRGRLRRDTVWKWGSFSTVHQDHGPYGVHLSTGTYDFGPNGESSESSIFSNTAQDELPSFRFYDAPGVEFRKLDEGASVPTATKWVVRGPDLDLEFTPHGGRFFGKVNVLGVVTTDLWHMWGTYSGTAPLRVLYRLGGTSPNATMDGSAGTIQIGGVPGVLEDHVAKW